MELISEIFKLNEIMQRLYTKYVRIVRSNFTIKLIVTQPDFNTKKPETVKNHAKLDKYLSNDIVWVQYGRQKRQKYLKNKFNKLNIHTWFMGMLSHFCLHINKTQNKEAMKKNTISGLFFNRILRYIAPIFHHICQRKKSNLLQKDIYDLLEIISHWAQDGWYLACLGVPPSS